MDEREATSLEGLGAGVTLAGAWGDFGPVYLVIGLAIFGAGRVLYIRASNRGEDE